MYKPQRSLEDEMDAVLHAFVMGEPEKGSVCRTDGETLWYRRQVVAVHYGEGYTGVLTVSRIPTMPERTLARKALAEIPNAQETPVLGLPGGARVTPGYDVASR